RGRRRLPRRALRAAPEAAARALEEAESRAAAVRDQRPLRVLAALPVASRGRLRVAASQGAAREAVGAVQAHETQPRFGRGARVPDGRVMRTTIEVRGARENNLKTVNLEIPRDSLVVVTGMSGSGKSSLAFDTIYAEGQRRLLASMSTFAKRFIGQLKKPDVDFAYGLSPVVSIDQKTVGANPRSTVGTMTDVADYLRILFATLGTPHCPACEEAIPVRTAYQMAEHVLSLPKGTEVEVRAPVFKIYGEDYQYLFEQIRVNGYRRARI